MNDAEKKKYEEELQTMKEKQKNMNLYIIQEVNNN